MDEIERDLRRTLRDLLEDTDITAPGDFASRLAEELRGPELRRTCELLLRGWVLREISVYQAQQRGSRKLAPSEKEVAARPSSVANRSKRVAAIRAQAPKWLRDRVSTGPGAKDWKMKGDCTYEDLLYLSKARNDAGEKLIRASQEYAELADLVAKNGVGKLRDLPPEVLAGIGEYE